MKVKNGANCLNGHRLCGLIQHNQFSGFTLVIQWVQDDCKFLNSFNSANSNESNELNLTELLIWVYSDPGVNSYAFRTNSLNNSNSCHSITQELRNSECLNQNFGLFELFHFANFCNSFRTFGLRHWDQSKSVWGCAWMQMFAFFQWHAENR